MMSLKSVMLIVLALLFFAAGGYFFHRSTHDDLDRTGAGAHPARGETTTTASGLATETTPSNE